MFRLTERASRWMHLAVLPLVAGVATTWGANIAVERVLVLDRLETLEAPIPPLEDRIGFNPSIHLLEVTDKTLHRYGFDENDRLRRSVYAELLRRLEKAGAKTVLFDLVFGSETSYDREFVEALRQTHLKVTLSTRFAEPDRDHPNVRKKDLTPRGFEGDFVKIPIYDPTAMPNVRLACADGAGPPDDTPDEGGNVFVGAMPMQYARQGPPLIYAAFMAALQQRGLEDRTPEHDPDRQLFVCGDYEYPLQGGQYALVIPTHSPREIHATELSQAMDDLVGKNAEKYKGGLVVVGWPEAEPPAVVPKFGEISRPKFVAMMVNTALSRPSRRSAEADQRLYLPLAATLSSVAFLLGFGRHPLLAMIGVAGLSGLAWYSPEVLAGQFHLIFPRVIPLIAVLAGGALGLVAGVSPLFRQEHRAEGHIEEATILFLDVRGSTRLLEQLGPERYRRIVGDLLSASTKAIAAHGGSVERTLGDGLLATFRSQRGRHHAFNAISAVEPLLQAAKAVSRSQEAIVEVGIGIETGMVTGGYVTEGGRPTWSSAGRTVNLAQRLQSASESLGVNVVIGPVAARLVDAEWRIEPLPAVHAKGFADPVTPFTVALGRTLG